MKEIDFERYLEKIFNGINDKEDPYDFEEWFKFLSINDVCKYANQFAAEVYNDLT